MWVKLWCQRGGAAGRGVISRDSQLGDHRGSNAPPRATFTVLLNPVLKCFQWTNKKHFHIPSFPPAISGFAKTATQSQCHGQEASTFSYLHTIGVCAVPAMVTVEIGQNGGGFHILNAAEGLALLPLPIPQSSLLSHWDHSTGGQLDLRSFAVQDALPSWLTDNRGGKHYSTLILPRTRPHECCPPPLTPLLLICSYSTHKRKASFYNALQRDRRSQGMACLWIAPVYGGCNIFWTEATQWRSQLSGKVHREQSIVIMS